MLNKLLSFNRQYALMEEGDTVICALSGGADSVALLFALYLLKDKLGITLEAAHFNHHLRGEESDRDENFAAQLCDRYDIPLHRGSGTVVPGKKGLEAAARDARYGYFRTLEGKIATAHTADDNAETVLMHLVRGTGLKGLGGIAPKSGNLIRPMLTVTRQEVEGFLEEWCLSHITDSSNETDAFLRNRLRHHVMPLLKQENPKLAENLSAMALNLRQDEAVLASLTGEELPDVDALREMPAALRSRALEGFLKRSGVKEPEQVHISQAEKLVFSDNPSARASFPGGVTVTRCYNRLEVAQVQEELPETVLTCPGEVLLGEYRCVCTPAETAENDAYTFTVVPQGTMVLRSRRSGDAIRLSGGTKQLKKLFIDRKIPAARRSGIPVLCDDRGILGVCGVGADLDRQAKQMGAVTVRFWKREKE